MFEIESSVKSYCKSFPVKFVKAKESYMYDENNNAYLDFFTGAGTMNYGHNNELVNNAIIGYIKNDGILHSLDLYTSAKEKFLNNLNEFILKPRKLNYKVQFCSPSGTNGVESALKLAKKAKKRKNIIAFTNSFHGMSLGSLSVTANSYYKNKYLDAHINVNFAMFDNYLGENIDTSEILEKLLKDKSSGVEIPAAIILETIQADGGVNVASINWLKNIRRICDELDILMIVDDVQVGNGRSGDFFSFERADIIPDMVVLSKAIGGGMPLSILLYKEELDNIWNRGEHTGTFRGNNLSFVAGVKCLEYWKDDNFSLSIKEKSKFIEKRLNDIKSKYINSIRGYGFIWGIVMNSSENALKVREECFKNGLILELVGANDEVVKLLPPLIITQKDLEKGLDILEKVIKEL
jgi:diaminobutyrate-2-oxoglutarate transaminase